MFRGAFDPHEGGGNQKRGAGKTRLLAERTLSPQTARPKTLRVRRTGIREIDRGPSADLRAGDHNAQEAASSRSYAKELFQQGEKGRIRGRVKIRAAQRPHGERSRRLHGGAGPGRHRSALRREPSRGKCVALDLWIRDREKDIPISMTENGRAVARADEMTKGGQSGKNHRTLLNEKNRGCIENRLQGLPQRAAEHRKSGYVGRSPVCDALATRVLCGKWGQQKRPQGEFLRNRGPGGRKNRGD